MAKTYLEIEQEDGTIIKFKKERIKARWVKEVLKLQKKLGELGQKGDFEEALDLRVKFVVDLFNDPKLTEDMIYDGIDSENFVAELDRIGDDIVGKSEEKEAGKL